MPLSIIYHFGGPGSLLPPCLLPPASSSSFLLISYLPSHPPPTHSSQACLTISYCKYRELHQQPILPLPNSLGICASRTCIPPLLRGKTVDTLIIILNAALTEDAGDLCAVPTNILTPHRLQAHWNSCGQDSSRGVALSRSNRF